MTTAYTRFRFPEVGGISRVNPSTEDDVTERDQELGIAEARLMIAACVYVDAAADGDWVPSATWEGLKTAVAAYRDALRGAPLPADHPLVAQGMAVVERLLRGAG